MKTTLLFIFIFSTLSSTAQQQETVVKRDNNGNIRSVYFGRNEMNIPKNSEEFLLKIVKKRAIDDFFFDKSRKTTNGMRFERLQQYFKGIKVEGGHFNFRYKNDEMKVVTGHYVDVTKINTVPSITADDAINSYISFIGLSKNEIMRTSATLLIKEIPNKDNHDQESTFLLFKIHLEDKGGKFNEVGFIDAHTGKLLLRQDCKLHSSATSSFYTYYNRNANDTPKTGITEYNGSNYTLWDRTRGNGIKTKKSMSSFDFIDYYDQDNIWTRSELGTDNIALDVHWTLERIYDCLENIFDYNSYDGNNGYIEAHIDQYADATFDRENNTFTFGTSCSSSSFDPFASVDIIGHEFGHAILWNSTGWQDCDGYAKALHEGFADIWGIIFETHIKPGSDNWKAGEEITIGYSCLNDFKNPENSSAYIQMASCWGPSLNINSDEYLVSGIFSHWFYLLSQGKTGINTLNNEYSVLPVGVDLAEELVAYATLTTAYLEDFGDFFDISAGFYEAALDMGNNFLAEQVQNAFYAVGLDIEPNHIYSINQSGAPTKYYVYLENGFTLNWNYINNSSYPSPSLVVNNSDFSCSIYSATPYNGILQANISYGSLSVTYSINVSGGANTATYISENRLQVTPVDKSNYKLTIVERTEQDGVSLTDYIKMPVEIKIYNAKSSQLQNMFYIFGNAHVINTSSWEEGTYIIQAKIGSEPYSLKFFVK